MSVDVGRMSRRQMLQLAGLAAVGGLLVACQPQVAEEAVPKEVDEPEPVGPAAELTAGLEVWAYPYTENDLDIVWKPLIAKFNDTYPGIVINMDVQPWGGRREKLYAAAAAGEPPDLWRGTSDTTPVYVEKGIIVDLTDLVPPEALEDFHESEIAAGSYEGRYYMLMTSQQIMGYGYNGRIMRELGYDDDADPIVTWDGMLDVAEQAKSLGYYLDQVSTISWPQWIREIRQAGGTTYAADRSRALMTEEPAVDLLTHWVRLFENEYVPLEGAVATDEGGVVITNYFEADQQAAMHTQLSGYCVTSEQDRPELEFRMASPRQRRSGDPLTAGNSSGDGFCIAKASKDLDACLLWGLFTIEPENIGLFGTLSGTTPLGTKSLTYWETEPCVKAWVEQNAQHHFVNQDSTTLWQESKVVCGPHFQAAVLGQATVEQALEACEEELNALLKEVYG